MRPALVLVDSSFFITWQRQQVNPWELLLDFETDYEFAINGVIWADVLRGRIDPHVRDRYDRAFALTRMLHLSARGWQRVARLAWELDRAGTVIPLPDVVIGVTALEHGAAVLTFDRHYQRIPGLTTLSELT